MVSINFLLIKRKLLFVLYSALSCSLIFGSNCTVFATNPPTEEVEVSLGIGLLPTSHSDKGRIGINLSFENHSEKYIKEYYDIAVLEMHRSGIPASVTLAQAIHESSWGSGELACNANNHFNIKCKSEWHSSEDHRRSKNLFNVELEDYFDINAGDELFFKITLPENYYISKDEFIGEGIEITSLSKNEVIFKITIRGVVDLEISEKGKISLSSSPYLAILALFSFLWRKAKKSRVFIFFQSQRNQFSKIKDLIASGNIKRALDILSLNVSIKNVHLHEQILILQSRLSELFKSERIGTCNREDIEVERNRIAKGVLGILSEMEAERKLA